MSFISCKKINFNGEMVTIFYERVLNRAIVAVANILSIRGELPGAPHTKATYSEEEVTDFVATRLMDVQRIPIDDARKCLARLVRRMELHVNFRRIEKFEDFQENTIFKGLGIPLYHGWKVVPELPVVSGSSSISQLELTANWAKDVPLTFNERDFVRNCYEETNCTSYGYIALNEDLKHVENELCVFYWNWKFYTLHKNVNGLVVLNHRGEWEGIFEGKNKIMFHGPSLGGRKFFLTCAGMNCVTFNYIQQDFRNHQDILRDIDIEINDYEESLDPVVDYVVSGKRTDMILFNYNYFNESQTARERIKEWRASLRVAGFVGVVVALIWYNAENEDGLTGIRCVRVVTWKEERILGGSFFR